MNASKKQQVHVGDVVRCRYNWIRSCDKLGYVIEIPNTVAVDVAGKLRYFYRDDLIVISSITDAD